MGRSRTQCPARVGDVVLSQDGPLGRVESVIRWPRRRYPVIPSSLVATVDRRRGNVLLRGRRRALARLPETAPIVL